MALPAAEDPTLVVSSLENPRAKRMRSLRLAKFRDKHDSFLLESPKLLWEALEADIEIRDCFLLESFRSTSEGQLLSSKLKEKGTGVGWVSEKVMRSISTLETTPGAVAAVKRTTSTLGDMLSALPEMIVVGEDIQDPGNAGTMIRTCQAAGFPAVVLCGASADFFNPKVVRAASGAIFHCLLARHARSGEVLLRLKEAGYRIVAAVSGAGSDCFEVSWLSRTALVFGNEGRGLSEDTLGLADVLVHVPMSPRVESLNVASCCAILLYEAVRQRRANLRDRGD